MKKLLAAVIILFISAMWLLSCSSSAQIQTPATPQSITNAIDSSNWQFVPLQAMPLYGRSRIVTSDFSARLKQDKLVVYLPYFGRANAGANILSGKGPLDFTSTDFTKEVLHPKESEWNITFKPKDNTEVQQMIFSLFTNGSATLNMILTNRSSISFSGSVVPAR